VIAVPTALSIQWD